MRESSTSESALGLTEDAGARVVAQDDLAVVRESALHEVLNNSDLLSRGQNVKGQWRRQGRRSCGTEEICISYTLSELVAE